jgi:hypothetical protein
MKCKTRHDRFTADIFMSSSDTADLSREALGREHRLQCLSCGFYPLSSRGIDLAWSRIRMTS